MKYILLALLFGGILQANYSKAPYKLGGQVLLEDRMLLAQSVYQDWCVDGTVWRQYLNGYHGSLEQVLGSIGRNKQTTVIPCPDEEGR